MDPNETLRIARAGIARVDALEIEGNDAGQNDVEDINDAAFDALEAYRQLDHWITRGGFLPDEWGKS